MLRKGKIPPIFATRTALPMRRVSHCGGRVQEVKASKKFYNNKKRLSFVCPPRFACDTHMSRTMLRQATLGNFTTLLHSASPCFLTAMAPWDLTGALCITIVPFVATIVQTYNHPPPEYIQSCLGHAMSPLSTYREVRIAFALPLRKHTCWPVRPRHVPCACEQELSPNTGIHVCA